MKKIFILCSLCTQFSFCEIGEDSLSLIASVNENLDEKQTSLDEKWIPKLEKYFTKYEICQSKIEQIDHLGNVLQGQFWLKRSSGCMKLQYDSKNEKVVLVKGGKLTLYDPELKEKTVTSLHSFALSFFLDKILDLRKNIKVIGVIRHKGDIFIKLCNKNDEKGACGTGWNQSVYANENDQ